MKRYEIVAFAWDMGTDSRGDRRTKAEAIRTARRYFSVGEMVCYDCDPIRWDGVAVYDTATRSVIFALGSIGPENFSDFVTWAA